MLGWDGSRRFGNWLWKFVNNSKAGNRKNVCMYASLNLSLHQGILPISSDFVNIYFSAHPSTLPPSILQFVLHASTTLFLRCDPISKGFWKFEGMNIYIRSRRKMAEFVLRGECFFSPSISNWIRVELALMEGSTLDLWWFYFHITEGERVRFWGEAKTLSAHFVLEYRV